MDKNKHHQIAELVFVINEIVENPDTSAVSLYNDGVRVLSAGECVARKLTEDDIYSLIVAWDGVHLTDLIVATQKKILGLMP
jgi:hypothetical protein